MSKILMAVMLLASYFPAYAFAATTEELLEMHRKAYPQETDQEFQRLVDEANGKAKGACRKTNLFGPSNYQECLQRYAKGQKSEVAAKAIANSCRQEFVLCEDNASRYECLRKNLEDVETEAAARAIINSCRDE